MESHEKFEKFKKFKKFKSLKSSKSLINSKSSKSSKSLINLKSLKIIIILIIKPFLKTFVFSFLVASLLIACGGDNNEEALAPPSNVDDGGGSDDGIDTPVGEVSSAGFWVNSHNDEFPTYVSSEEGFGTECLLDSSDPLGVLNCFVDVPEGDLYNNPLQLQYNAPPNLCQHVGVTPSWHWNFSSGVGPRNITVDVTITEDGAETVDACTANRTVALPGEAAVVSCVDHPEIFGFNLAGEPICIYDHSLGGGIDGLPNCCFGGYVITKRTDTDRDGTYETVNIEPTEWGGEPGDCIGGAPRTGTGTLDDLGLPITELTQVPSDGEMGLNAEISIAANSQSALSSFSYPANFYTKVGQPHSHDGYYSTRTSEWPYAFDPVDDLDGNQFGAGFLRIPRSDGYLIECLDEAFELKYAINVFVREWNTIADFFTYGTSQGETYLPDVVGVEGVDCFGFSGPCNDQRDFDDILLESGGTYDTTPGSTANSRNLYFPRVIY